MFGWLRSKRGSACRQAEVLMAQHGQRAYELARSHRIRSLGKPEHHFWCAVARVIADRAGRTTLDTATRYLEPSPDTPPTQNVLSGRHREAVSMIVGKAHVIGEVAGFPARLPFKKLR